MIKTPMTEQEFDEMFKERKERILKKLDRIKEKIDKTDEKLWVTDTIVNEEDDNEIQTLDDVKRAMREIIERCKGNEKD